jgi:hypothetical protein
MSGLSEVNILVYNADIKGTEISIKRRGGDRIILGALNIVNKNKDKILPKGASYNKHKLLYGVSIYNIIISL